MAKREVLSATEVEQHVAVDIVNVVTLGAARVAERHDPAGLLVCIHVRSTEDSLVPLAGEVGTRGLSLSKDGRLGESGDNTGGEVVLPHKFTLDNVQHFI